MHVLKWNMCTAHSGKDNKVDSKQTCDVLSSVHGELLREMILEAQRTGSYFLDPTFPPDSSSLYVDPAKPPKGAAVKGWRRPIEFCPGDPYLFKDGVGAGDVMQGKLGDWYIIYIIRTHLLINL